MSPGGGYRLAVFLRRADDFLEALPADLFLAEDACADDFLLEDFFAEVFLRVDFFVEDLPKRSIDDAPRCAFLAVFPTEEGMLLAISFAFAPATPPTTAPTAAPRGPTIEPAAAPAAAPPTMPSADPDFEPAAEPLEFAIEESSLRQPGRSLHPIRDNASRHHHRQPVLVSIRPLRHVACQCSGRLLSRLSGEVQSGAWEAVFVTIVNRVFPTPCAAHLTHLPTRLVTG